MSKTSAVQRKALDAYYAALANYDALGVIHEQATRHPFAVLLEVMAKARGWTLVLEQELPGKRLRPDATLVDEMQLPRGYWEAKDAADDLTVEIKRKIDRGYSLSNTLFEDTRRAVLYQNGRLALEADIANRAEFTALLDRFFDFTEEQVADFYQAVKVFGEKIPELAEALKKIIAAERKDNARFNAAFSAFHELCRSALDPNLRASVIEEMLVQHLLTERLFRTIFNNSDFAQRNAIAVEIEKVIRALTSRAFSRTEFLKRLDHFYTAIEATAASLEDFAQKQAFLNTVYERFFQDYSRDQADTHGIVYTPQPIVDFQCASIEVILQREFGLSLADSRVALIDPCVGTGNYVVNLLNRVPRSALKRKYQNELWCNEIMLLPYYIASLNIEHTYFERTGEYAPFEGICFTDTLELVERDQPFLPIFGEENTERVAKQRQAPITVIVGNPPYNVGQKSENDNNKNRAHEVIDQRINATYAKDSNATLKTQLYDPYVRFFRWAIDRLGDRDGIVCFVSNNSFVDQIAFDGMRRHLAQDFTAIYHLDLHGNVRKNPKLSGTTHNVFGIQVGVGITVLVRRRAPLAQTGRGVGGEGKGRTANDPHPALRARPLPEMERALPATLYYHRVPEDWRKSEKLAFLTQARDITGIEWQSLTPDAKHNWLTEGMRADFESFLPLGPKEARVVVNGSVQSVYRVHCPGVSTDRDNVVYDFDDQELGPRIEAFIEEYNAEVSRWDRAKQRSSIDDFVKYDKLKWSANLKANVKRGVYAEYDPSRIRCCFYRPFSKRYLYYDPVLNDRPALFKTILPISACEAENLIICLTDPGSEKPLAHP